MRTHPGRVAPGQVVVERQDVNSLSGQGVKIGGKDGRQGLALPCRKLGDLSAGHGKSGDELGVERVEAQNATGRLPDEGECLDEPVVRRKGRVQRHRVRRRRERTSSPR